MPFQSGFSKRCFDFNQSRSRRFQSPSAPAGSTLRAGGKRPAGLVNREFVRLLDSPKVKYKFGVVEILFACFFKSCCGLRSSKHKPMPFLTSGTVKLKSSARGCSSVCQTKPLSNCMTPRVRVRLFAGCCCFCRPAKPKSFRLENRDFRQKSERLKSTDTLAPA